MQASLRVLVAVGCLGLCAACGDDEGDVLGGDAGLDGGSGVDKIPRMDSGTSETAVAFCDRYDPASCPGDETCTEVVEYFPETDQAQIYTGCVDVGELRGLGDPCSPWNDVYTKVPEELYYDACGGSLVCSPDPEIRGASTCQQTCQTGRYGDGFVGCESESAFCLSIGAYEEVCRESDKCDPFAQKGCGKGEGCYLRLNDLADGYLSLCLPVPPEDELVDDHAPCTYVNDCHPGSSCTGPVNLAPEEWLESDYACRPLCTGEADDQDAGSDDDARLADDCPGVAECVPFAGSGFGLAQIPKAPFGQCER